MYDSEYEDYTCFPYQKYRDEQSMTADGINTSHISNYLNETNGIDDKILEYISSYYNPTNKYSVPNIMNCDATGDGVVDATDITYIHDTYGGIAEPIKK